MTKEHFEPVSKRDEKVKITSIASKDSVNFQYKKRDEATKTFTLKKGDSLSIINEAFEGITVTAISKSTVEFSNSIQKSTGEELDVDIFMTSYQEQMMRLALECHFETEKTNFCGRNFKIKTLALFFIDNKINCARVFFDMLSKDGYTVYFHDQLNNKQMAQIIKKCCQNVATVAITTRMNKNIIPLDIIKKPVTPTLTLERDWSSFAPP